jgi:hypothetical protein
MAHQGKGKASSLQQEVALVITKYEQQRQEQIEGNNRKNMENNLYTGSL